ncbi:MAG TPA: recombinase family protein [Chloroflexi bacterium]|nr:recombinase family protein [Chloroflexota bacterium]
MTESRSGEGPTPTGSFFPFLDPTGIIPLEEESMTRVALYARVSTEMQAEEGLSIAAQLAEMREYAKKQGWEVVAEFVDAGVSGSTMDRPGLQALLQAAEEGAFDVVLVHELSRLSRSVFDTFNIFNKLGRYGIGFASVKEPQFDLSTPHGRMFLGIITNINQYYLDMLKLHTKKSKRQRVRQGLYNASIPPYGYRHTGDSRTPPEIVEEEAKVVRLAFEAYASGRYSYRKIAEMLNSQGYRTRSGRRFSKDTIADMLRNPFYVGKVVYKEGLRGQDAGEVYDGLHEPIISEALWNAVEKVRRRQQHASRRFQPQIRPYLLSQLAHCRACGRRLRAQGAKTGSYYREMSYARGFDDCPYGQIGAHVEPLHRQIGAVMRLLRLPEDWQEELAAMIGPDEEVAALESRRARLIAERRRLKRAYLRGDFNGEDEDIYLETLRQIREELAKLPSEDELRQIREAARTLESVGEVWDEADEADRRDLVRLVLRRVQVDVVQDRVVLLEPLAPFIPLFRSIPLVEEREFGVFTPVWPLDADLPLPCPRLSPLTELPGEPVQMPFLPLWPWEPDPEGRISPILSLVLKERRKEGREGGLVVSVPHVGVPPLKLDERKWSEVRLERLPLAEVLAREEGSVAFLATPLGVQSRSDREGLAERVFRLLEESGYWYIIDVLPASMPAHWVFRYFPQAWSHAGREFWRAYDFYNTLRRAGFQVEQEERTFYEPVSAGVALEIARRREGLLGALPHEAYEERLRRLEEKVAKEGPDAPIASEVTLVVILARKGERAARRFRRRKLCNGPTDRYPPLGRKRGGGRC